MPTFKATWAIRYKQAGSSISLYRDGTNHAECLDKAAQLARNVIAPLLGLQSEIASIRVSDIAIEKDSMVKDVNILVDDAIVIGKGKTKQGKAIVPFEPNDNNSCLLLRLIASPLRKGRIYFRFYPDGVAQGSKYLPTLAYDTGMDELATELRNNGWGFLGVPTGKGVPIKNIQTNGVAPNTVVITAPGHGLAADQQCRVSKVKGNNLAINNTWKVFSVAGNDVVLASSNGLAGFVWNGDGFIKSLTKTVSVVQTIEVAGRIAERKSGRPFGVQVGRRRARRK